MQVTQQPAKSRTWAIKADVDGYTVADLLVHVVTQPGFVWEKSDFYV
jgi:hypothetical protein